MICANLLNNLEKINIMTQSRFNIFNIIFVVLASIIAALGFLYNSTDAILGSMIVSSLTNPLFTFVILFLINQYTNSIYKLFNFGFLFIIAIIVSVTIGYMNQSYKVFNTPTHEMKTRVKISHVIIDVILALLSGFGLGIALINKDIVSKVGFNIILAVTPPVVNFGLFYGQALFKYLHKNDQKKNNGNIIKELMENGNRSLILSGLNILAMFLTLFLTVTILCKVNNN
jgi:uncharacterized membrane protein